jgi:solute carrier family 34 (sodium-dependent phosphate cotransporter)
LQRSGQTIHEIEGIGDVQPGRISAMYKLGRTARLAGALYVFIGALQILKTGASDLGLVNSGGILVANAGSTLGVGWIGAMMTLSGSTMAATGLTLRAAGAISEVQGFTMVTGARLGAAFVVLMVAVIYALRRGKGRRKRTVSVAVLTLIITAVIYLPGALIGLLILRSGPFQSLHLAAPAEVGGLIDLLYGWLIARIESWPSLLIVLVGLVLLVLAFRSIDALVPEMDEQRLQGSRLQWLRRKWPTFLLGVLVVIATLSVSVALTILVPLVAKGYVERENLIPYIVGADLGTLVDKLAIAFVVGVGGAHPASPVRIILAEIVGTAFIGMLIMTFFYVPFSRGVWNFQHRVTRSRTRLAAFTASLFAIPLLIIAVSALFG